MIIIEDTRNQITKHEQLNADLIARGHQVVRSKLIVGDYARLDNQTLAIDTKKDWVEVANNLTQDHERFKNECMRAKSCDIRLIIVVEENISVEQWKSPIKRNGKVYTQVKGETLGKIIKTMEDRYGVTFIFCDKKNTAKLIEELLGGLI